MAGTNYPFPQKSPAMTAVDEKGIASLTHGGRTFRFRTNPNQFQWSYTLNKRIDQTYGGRVIQLLGTKIEDFVFKADSGGGRWAYSNSVAKFCRDVMIDQRNGEPATFEYTKRGWKLNVFVVSVPFQDSVTEVLREFEITCKVQEDVTGLLSKNSLDAELSKLTNGVGFRRGPYNDPTKQNDQLGDVLGDGFGALPTFVNAAGQIAGVISDPTGNSPFLPNGLPILGTSIGR